MEEQHFLAEEFFPFCCKQSCRRVPRVSLVALRLALAEMLYGDEKKPGVVINEAVELTKKYGADEDYQFVNGLLGTVAREQGLDAEPEQL